MNPREAAKAFGRGVALILVAPALLSYFVRAKILGRDRALHGSTQMLALIPGLPGEYLRRAFLSRTLAGCHHTATISFGTLFSQAGANIDENVYIGPGCHLGLVHIERDALLASGVHVPSGAQQHGTVDPTIPIRDQEGQRLLVRIGAGAWIGSAAVVMAEVGKNSIVGAGAVVTRPIPENVVAAGVPAKIIGQRQQPR